MTTLRGVIARHPISVYVAIAFAFTWVFTFAVNVSVAFGLIALFGPAIAAIIVTRADGTWPELKARITGWRRHVGWYGLALGVPFVVAGVARLLLTMSGGTVEGFGSISAIEVVIFVLVIGEETGWRGFLQPRLRARYGLATAGLLTGLVWVLWHLPIYLNPEQGIVGFLQFAWWVLPLSVAMGVIAEGARFSIIVTTVMHGAANIAMPILLPGVDRSWWLVVTGVLYAVVAAIVVIAANRRAAPEPSASPVATT